MLLIGEHGDYPYNAKGQKKYPRYEMFQKIVGVFGDSKKTVPVFNDKHLYYDRRKAFEMVATAKKMGFPMLAGSSLPVTWRRPELELPLGVKIKDALVVSPANSKSWEFTLWKRCSAWSSGAPRASKGSRASSAVRTIPG